MADLLDKIAYVDSELKKIALDAAKKAYQAKMDYYETLKSVPDGQPAGKDLKGAHIKFCEARAEKNIAEKIYRTFSEELSAYVLEDRVRGIG